jgi:hypothetical protein
MATHDELSIQCIICLQHFELPRTALCSCVEVRRHFICHADLDTWVWSDTGLLVPCPACTFNAPLARPAPEDVSDSMLELEGICLKLEGLHLY